MSRYLALLACAIAAIHTSNGFSFNIGQNNLASVQVKPKDEGFHVTVQAQDQDYNLTLKKPDNSIFAPGFKFTVLDINDDGIPELTDHTPSAEDLQAIDHHTYHDPKSNTVVNIREHNGTYHLHGTIDNRKISHHEDELHILAPPEAHPQPSTRINDYVDLNRTIVLGPRTRQSLTMTTASPEVLILFDYANYQQFSGSTNAINDYLSVFYHAVNNRFATNSNPKITVTVSGVLAFNSRSAQPFLEEAKIPDGTAYDMNVVLDKLSYWVYANRNGLAKHDIASFISAEEFKSPDSSGKYVSGIAGLAYLRGACWTHGNNRFLGTSVNADKGGYWNGVVTVAHELAHNLNAPHDGDNAASTCPWSEGYIMSYEGWGTKNKFYFSPCSQRIMSDFINSASGACVKSFQAPSRWTLSQDNPGDRLDLTAQCRKLLNKPEATSETANRTPQDICRNIKCRVPDTPTRYYIYTMNRMPADNSPCGSNMVCRDGECVAKSTSGK